MSNIEQETKVGKTTKVMQIFIGILCAATLALGVLSFLSTTNGDSSESHNNNVLTESPF
ncbi:MULTISPECIES: hypothetical protein [Grimontia]|uniref:Uncharacterized protein n=1 Tax=Grimontia marina TaxID=646534 RepID=A0A128FA20_9GAMM|nr:MULTISPECIES: hypothetical protein [Grimontia]WRV96271.1 hypothetical protein VP504_08990 [Grimontia sp. NTOU-MAR1]CZF83365.1 hypothetical protein GMA8713_02633 [Grimontia marina]